MHGSATMEMRESAARGKIAVPAACSDRGSDFDRPSVTIFWPHESAMKPPIRRDVTY
jgi:hypothetical protein